MRFMHWNFKYAVGMATNGCIQINMKRDNPSWIKATSLVKIYYPIVKISNPTV